MIKMKPLLLCLFSLTLTPAAIGNMGESRSLKFYHTHTHKTLEVTYFTQGDYSSKSLEKLRLFLADWRNGHQHVRCRARRIHGAAGA
jgi:uncharacterized protein YcbK (DUF882 family)